MSKNVSESTKNKVDIDTPHRYASYIGRLEDGRMEGLGNFMFENDAVYEGHFKDGQFHGKGTLMYPSGARFNGMWKEGKVTAGFYQFADGLAFDQNNDALTGWRYLNPVWDRRFFPEICTGVRTVHSTMKAPSCSGAGGCIPPKLPADCFDTGDGFYHPASRNVYRYFDTCTSLSQEEVNDRKNWTVLRHVIDEEGEWIKAKCRKGNDEPVGPVCLPMEFKEETIENIADEALEKQGNFSRYSMKLNDIATAKIAMKMDDKISETRY